MVLNADVLSLKVNLSQFISREKVQLLFDIMTVWKKSARV